MTLYNVIIGTRVLPYSLGTPMHSLASYDHVYYVSSTFQSCPLFVLYSMGVAIAIALNYRQSYKSFLKKIPELILSWY